MAEYTLHTRLHMRLVVIGDRLLRRGSYLGAGEEYPRHKADQDQDQKDKQPGTIHFSLFVDRLKENNPLVD